MRKFQLLLIFFDFCNQISYYKYSNVLIAAFFINLTQFLQVFSIFFTKNVARKTNQCPSPLQEKMLSKTYESCSALDPILKRIGKSEIDNYKCDVNVKVGKQWQH